MKRAGHAVKEHFAALSNLPFLFCFGNRRERTSRASSFECESECLTPLNSRLATGCLLRIGQSGWISGAVNVFLKLPIHNNKKVYLVKIQTNNEQNGEAKTRQRV
jgi:hypothetical protein